MCDKSKNMCCIVIPVYKEKLSQDECISLMQCLNVLKNYDIYIITFNELNLQNYISIFDKSQKKLRCQYFDKQYFVSTQSYNRLMLNKDFYKKFDSYKYMLIYQLDAFVFKDCLIEWCNKGFDYIGAPWFVDYDTSEIINIPFLEYSGNGGFSLRNIKKMYKLLSMNIFGIRTFDEFYKINKKRQWIRNIIRMPIFYKNWLCEQKKNIWQLAPIAEDVLIVKCARQFYANFKIATAQEAIPFAFESKPHYLFRLNDNKLPFGCHAYKRYNNDVFWKKYIKMAD